LHLDFIPSARERFDLEMRRYDYFEPQVQKFLTAIQSSAVIEWARKLGGYEITGLMKVVLNIR